MKFILCTALLVFSAISVAQPSNVTVRCYGTKAAGVQIGLDIVLDPVDRILDVTSFEREATNPIDVQTLIAPSHFLKRDKSGNLEMFGFKTFNDGLIEDVSVFYSKNDPKSARLQLTYLPKDKAIKNITCEIL